MPKFEIYFFGLICFHGGSPRRDADRTTKKFAKLIDDPTHVKSIYLNTDSPDGLSRDDEVSFGSIGESTVLDTFRDYVPHLVDLTTKVVTLNFRTHGATVLLPSGKLATVDWYTNQGHYELGADITPDKCIARVNLLQFETSDANVIVKYGRNSHEVPSDGWVFITNAEPSHDPSTPGPGQKIERKDFRPTHKAILVPPNEDNLARLFEFGEKCRRPASELNGRHLEKVLAIIDKQYLDVSLHPECSNSQWP